MTDHRQDRISTASSKEPERGLFLHTLFQKRLPGDRHINLPLLARLCTLRQAWRTGLVAWYLLALGLAGWLGFTYVQNVRVLQETPTLEGQTAVATLGDPLPELKRLHEAIVTAERKNSTLIITRFGFDQSIEHERQLKARYIDLFDSTVRRMEGIGLAYWRGATPQFDARQKQLYAKFLLGQFQITTGAVKNDAGALKQYALLTDPLWQVLLPRSAEIPVGPLYLAYLKWQGSGTQSEQRLDYPQAMTDLLNRVRGQEAAWLWAAPQVTAQPVAIEDFWIDFPQPGWIEVPGGLTLQGRTQSEALLRQLLQPLAKEEADRITELFWQSYWQQFFTAWERFTSELLEQGRLLSESPGNIIAAGPVLRQDGPYWRLFVRFAEEMHGLPDTQNRPAWVRQWQVMAAAWDRFILQQNRKTGGVADKLTALATNALHTGEELAGQRVNLPVATRDQLAELFTSYLADLAALSPVTVPREERVDQFGKFFRGLQQGESSSFYTAYADYRKLVTLDGSGAEETLCSRLLFAPLAFIAQVALGETTTVLQQNWTETVIAPLASVNAANQLTMLFSQADSPVPKFIAGPAAPFLEASASGYRPRRGYGMTLPFRQDFLAFLFQGTRASNTALKEFTVTLAARPMNVNPEATTHPFASTLAMQCTGKQFVLENRNYASQAEFTWTPAACGDVVLTVQFPAGVTLSKRYPGALGFPQFLNDFSDGRHTYNLDEFSGDSGPLKEQQLTSLTLAYNISGGPDVRSFVYSVPPTIPDTIFTDHVVHAHEPPAGDEAMDHHKSIVHASDEILKIPAGLLRSYQPDPQSSASRMAAPSRQPAMPTDDAETWIRHQSPHAFTLQLMSVRSSRGLDAIREKYPAMDLHWYTTAGKTWHVLIAGSFATRQEARAALNRLPAELNRFNPLVRTFASVQADMEQPTPSRRPDASTNSEARHGLH